MSQHLLNSLTVRPLSCSTQMCVVIYIQTRRRKTVQLTTSNVEVTNLTTYHRQTFRYICCLCLTLAQTFAVCCPDGLPYPPGLHTPPQLDMWQSRSADVSAAMSLSRLHDAVHMFCPVEHVGGVCSGSLLFWTEVKGLKPVVQNRCVKSPAVLYTTLT